MRQTAPLRFVAAAVVGMIVWAPGPAPLHGQDGLSPQGEPRFEVASIKPTDMTPFELGRQAAAGGGVAMPSIGIRIQPNGMNASLATLEMLILSAYQIRNYQLVGGPDWMTSARFDVTARAAGPVTADVARQMLKTLLAERFTLRAHIESRQSDVHALVLARSGPGLKRTSAECEALLAERKKNPASTTPPQPPDFQRIRTQTTCGVSVMSSMASGASGASMGGVPLDRLVTQISSEIGGPVVDRTGLTGLFDILLEYASARRQIQVAVTPDAPDLKADIPPPTMRAALQEQLGLRLESQKGPVDFVVIDSVERPTAD
jgi:uncharacterized protein (TIGR03435 family)